ncbi:MAG: murein biosynthesis integral membrane protein MurJ [candidate division NC10 bacterium]|nr:murein biosynthesis integral membrane protein MurJ [candidate division NC10 bacterium]
MTQAESEHHGITRAAGAISSGVLVSRVLGFVRDMIIAKFFGAGMAADAFFVAFRIPNMLRELFGEGALSASFIPVFTETLNRKGREEAWRIARITGTALSSILFLIVTLGIAIAPLVVWVMAPGFHLYPEKMRLTILLTRITFPYLFFVGIASLFMGILNSFRHFTTPAFAPTMLNLAMIFSALFLSPYVNPPIASLAIGVLLGGIGQMAIQIPGLRREGARFSFDFQPQDPGVRKIGRLMLPGIIGLAITQANFFVGTFLASFLKQGSVSFLYYSFRLIQIPIGLVGVALGSAILPFLSSSATEGSYLELKRITSLALRLGFFITVPFTAGLILFRRPLVSVLFERGQFTELMSQEVAGTLLFLAFGICFYVGDRIVVSAFYSLQDTKTPVAISAVAVATDIGFSLLLMGPLQVRGLALATSIASFVHFCLLMGILRKKIGPLRERELLGSLLRISLSTIPLVLLCYAMLRGFPPLAQAHLAGKVGILTLEILIGMGSYLGAACLLRSQEVHSLVSSVRNRLRGAQGRP